MKQNILVVVIVIALAAGGIWYFKSSQASSVPPDATEQILNVEDTVAPALPSPETTGSEERTEKTVKEVLVEGAEYKFLPDTLTLKKGEKVRLVFKNTGKMTHNWVVDELGVQTKVISGGSEETIEFTPDQAGTFEYYCSVGKHRQMGMVGTLTVTP